MTRRRPTSTRQPDKGLLLLFFRKEVLASLTLSFAPQANAALSGNQGAELAASCASCHATFPHEAGIPPVAGLSETQIVQAMGAFRTGAREGAIMHVVAQALSPEETAAVAHYLARQRPAESAR